MRVREPSSAGRHVNFWATLVVVCRTTPGSRLMAVDDAPRVGLGDDDLPVSAVRCADLYRQFPGQKKLDQL